MLCNIGVFLLWQLWIKIIQCYYNMVLCLSVCLFLKKQYFNKHMHEQNGTTDSSLLRWEVWHWGAQLMQRSNNPKRCDAWLRNLRNVEIFAMSVNPQFCFFFFKLQESIFSRIFFTFLAAHFDENVIISIISSWTISLSSVPVGGSLFRHLLMMTDEDICAQGNCYRPPIDGTGPGSGQDECLELWCEQSFIEASAGLWNTIRATPVILLRHNPSWSNHYDWI